MLRWGAALIVLAAITLLATVWVAPGIPGGAVGVMAGMLALTGVVAAGMLRRARQWQQLATIPPTRAAALVEVIRVGIHGDRFGVDYRPIRGVRLPHSSTIDRWFDLAPPAPGERVDVWSLGVDGRGPLLTRQDDGTWWAASGSLY